jgi:type I restriction enzyme M protein
MPIRTPEEALANAHVAEAIRRGIVRIEGDRVSYNLNQQRSYDWRDPEEWVRAFTIAWLVVAKDYPANRLRTEVQVPRRVPGDFADVVAYRDDQCRTPYLVVENKAAGQTEADRIQWVEQVFGNANSLRSALALYEESDPSALFNVADFPQGERHTNRLGDRSTLPSQYGEVPEYVHIAGQQGDIGPVPALEARIRRAHYLIWAGGRRDPLTAFDEWSKLLFAKVMDERTTPTAQPRRFQFGARETTAAVANRIHNLFTQACRTDPTIFPADTRINLPDAKIADVVRVLQEISFTRTDVDSLGAAFEEFFGSVFRGELGQYFTMRQLARFTVAMLEINQDDYVLDPTAGSGGFLLEALLQTWHAVDRNFQGQPLAEIERLKTNFALTHVYGIEIHETLARICKINLLLHHDGHTNIETGRSCLDSVFTNARLNPPQGRFSKVVGNPPFGDEVKEGDEDHLGSNSLANFTIATGRVKADSEQVILERCINLLEPGQQLGLVMPDGVLNNQGWQSNCPQTRALLARSGQIEAIVSLPDHAFRKAGAQNKTSILFFKKFTPQQKLTFDRSYAAAIDQGTEEGEAIAMATVGADLNYQVFLAEANNVGYSTTGTAIANNDLYRSANASQIADDQAGTILGEWRLFRSRPNYEGRNSPDCMAVSFDVLWRAHASHRLDPKYHLFEREANRPIPQGWVRARIGDLMRRREAAEVFQDPDRGYIVMTLAQTGEIRPRAAGKGHNPPEWIGAYFSESPGEWFAAQTDDVVFSSIDLWKGCISVVPPAFNGALVSKEFPIYEITDQRLTPSFLQAVLRARYYQRAFRAITTGHSNRRRTQSVDFEALEVSFPPDRDEQARLTAGLSAARQGLQVATEGLRREMMTLSTLIDGRGNEELPDVSSEETEAEQP